MTRAFRCANPALFAKAYRSATRYGVAVWNPTADVQPLAITTADGRPLHWTGADGALADLLPAQEVALGVTSDLHSTQPVPPTPP